MSNIFLHHFGFLLSPSIGERFPMVRYEVDIRLGKAVCKNSTRNLCTYKFEEMVVYRRVLAFSMVHTYQK